MKAGFLLALEGIDGSGTTTQAAALQEHLESRGQRVHRTAEPSRGPIGLALRGALQQGSTLTEETLALMFAADRLDHLHREIEPALAEGRVVITDRYLLSSLAYQSTTVPLAWVLQLNSRARRPDASLLLRVDPNVAARRRQARGGAVERYDDEARQIAVARAYDEVFALSDVGAAYVLDANGDKPTVRRAITDLVDHLLGARA